MRTTELVLTAMVILGCIFKLQHWPGANALMFLGGGALAFFYFPFGYRTLAAPKPTDQILWSTLLVGSMLSLALAGLLAFHLHWPYSGLLLVLASCGCGLAFLAVLMLRYWQPRLDIYLDGLLIRCGVLGGLAFIIWGLFSGKPH